MKTLRFSLIVMFIASVSTTVSAQNKQDPTGTWTFFAEEAPDEYNSGDMVIQKEGEEYTAKIVFGENYELKCTGVTYENNEISFKVTIEGEPIPVKGNVGKESMEGTASTPDGSISFTAERKK